MFSQGVGRSQKHSVRDAPCTGCAHRQAHGRKNVNIVALSDAYFAPFIIDTQERRTGGDQGAALGPLKKVFGKGLGLGSEVGEWKDDGTLALARHLANDGFGESTGHCRKPDENGRVDLLNDVAKADAASGLSVREISNARPGPGVSPLLGR